MANEEHVAILRQGVEAWNQWREENSDVRPNLGRVHFHKASLRGADLTGADLTGANLRGADLTGANFRVTAFSNVTREGWISITRTSLQDADLQDAILLDADLTGADLTSANLTGASLTRARLQDADLQDAMLYGANFKRADLSKVNLQGARLLNVAIGLTIFANVDLRNVHGLGAVFHRGPSTIGIDTLYRSQGDIPEIFLRGCGVPDTMIKYARFLVTAERPIDYYLSLTGLYCTHIV